VREAETSDDRSRNGSVGGPDAALREPRLLIAQHDITLTSNTDTWGRT
jgi:hypothetical protein